MSKVILGARILLGLIFVVFGLNGFLQFLPTPPMPEAAMAYMMGLMGAGYFFPVLKATEIVAGALVLSGFYLPLGLVLLAPIVVQIALFHFFLAPDGAIMAVVILALEIFLTWAYAGSFKGVLAQKAKPRA